MVRVAAVIPTFNRCELLRTSIGQLQAQANDLPDLQLIIIVVNDGCTDRTEAMLTQNFPAIVQLNTPGNYWYTKSMNVGFQKALKLDVNHVLALNDDIDLKNDYLKQIIKAVVAYNEPIIMGSTSVTYEQPHRVTFSGVKSISWWRVKKELYHPYLKEVPFGDLIGVKKSEVLPGRGMLIDTKILKEIGLFDERLPQYGSDDEICLRAKKKGFQVLVSWDAILYSHHEMTGVGSPILKQSFTQYVRTFFNKYSRTYWKKFYLINSQYGYRLALPCVMFIYILGEFHSYFKNKLDL
jgi:GT2 family glycosyltransferase